MPIIIRGAEFTLKGKTFPLSHGDVFYVEVCRGGGKYVLRYRVENDPARAVEHFENIKIAAPYRKRLKMNGEIILKERGV